jgi:N-acetyl-D-muramate 6-phosphate phosphatase
VTRRVPAVALDAGETIIDETGQWTAWAEWLGETPFTVMVALGAILERGEPFKSVFSLFDDNFDIDGEIARRNALGTGYRITAAALHHDVRPAVAGLAAGGVQVVIAGTMTAAEQDEIRGLGLEVTNVISHSELGCTNREPEFFMRLAVLLGVEHDDLRYVSHRHDAVAPAAFRAGVGFLWLRRGPLARIKPPPVTAQPRDAADSLTGIAASILARRR